HRRWCAIHSRRPSAAAPPPDGIIGLPMQSAPRGPDPDATQRNNVGLRSAILVLVACACRDTNDKPKQSVGSDAPGSGSALVKDKQHRTQVALTRVPTIQRKIATLRGLPMERPIPAASQSTAEFREFVKRQLGKELPPDKAAKLQVAHHHIGLYTKAIDVVEVLEQTLTSQAAAYYDPAKKTFFVVMAPDDDVAMDTIVAHELTHAVQDQHFDLSKFMSSTLDDDASLARRFVVEGDATLAMFVYLAAEATGGRALQPAMMKALRAQIEALSAIGIREYGEMMRQQASALGGMEADLKTAMESMDELPPVIIQPLIDSYMKGARLAVMAYEAGGWTALDALYAQPPESTEQVLHPGEKLIGKRERPKLVALPGLPKGAELERNVIGELQWSIYFDQWGVKQLEAARGWGGDRYAVIKRDDGSVIAYIATTWDSPKDAQEFADAYVASLAQRFKGAETSKPEAGVLRTDRGKVYVRLKGSHVFIVDGGDDRKALDQLVRGTTIK
ncbi:MAG TPA: hypothetical protein VIU61_20475, partial [Kofleriaceae bacterium]